MSADYILTRGSSDHSCTTGATRDGIRVGNSVEACRAINPIRDIERILYGDGKHIEYDINLDQV